MRLYSGFAAFIKCNFPSLLLAFFWLLGLSGGYLLVRNYATDLPSLVYSIAAQPLSLVGQLVVVFIPFVLCIIAVHFHALFVLYPIAMVRSFLLGYCLTGIRIAFGSAGWLVRAFLLFSDVIVSPLFLWFLLRCLSRAKPINAKVLICLFSFLMIVSVFDYFLVSPFLVMIMSYL